MASSIYLDGNQYAPLTTRFATSGLFSYDFMIKMTDARTVCGYGGCAANPIFGDTSSSIYSTFGIGSGKMHWSYYAGGWGHAYNNTPINDDKVHHCVIVNNNGMVTFYVDGNPDGTTNTGSGSPYYCISHIGASYGSGYFIGNLDELRVWNIALTPEQVSSLYHGQIVTSDTPGLVAYWKCNEGSGVVANDSKGTNHASFNSVTWSNPLSTIQLKYLIREGQDIKVPVEQVCTTEITNVLTPYSKGIYSGDYGLDKLLDGDANTCFITEYSGVETWLAFKLSSRKCVGRIAMYQRNGYYPYLPKKFKILGSNDSTNGADGSWNILAQIDQAPLTTLVWNTYDFINNDLYQWYKLQGIPENGYWEIAEFRMFQVDSPAHWNTVASSITEEVFTTYGRDALYSMEYIKLLDNPELVVSCSDPIVALRVNYTLPSMEIYYAISFDNSHWYSFKNGNWIEITDIYNHGMKSGRLATIPVSKWYELLPQRSGTLYIKALMKSQDENSSPYIRNFSVNVSDYYNMGDYYVTTNENQFNTIDWERINSVSISEILGASNNDIRFAISRDNRATWEVYNDGWIILPSIESLGSMGMTAQQFMAITPEQWNTILYENELDVMDVALNLHTENFVSSPIIDQITFNYDKFPTPITVNDIQIPVPDPGYKYSLVDGIYILAIVEGVAFDEVGEGYNFYTTPDGIIIRPYRVPGPISAGLIGGRVSSIGAVEVINCFETANCRITLNAATTDQKLAEVFPTYGVLYDNDLEEGRTKIELTLDPDFVDLSYPLVFNLNAGETKIVYMKLYPTIYNGVGDKHLRIYSIARPI